MYFEAFRVTFLEEAYQKRSYFKSNGNFKIFSPFPKNKKRPGFVLESLMRKCEMISLFVCKTTFILRSLYILTLSI